MVTIIKANTSISRTLAYNENKVKIGTAQCIGAENYPLDLDKITDAMKLKRFTKRTSLNENTKYNTIHITLNFAPLEDHSKEKLMAITTIYMQRIGFGEQPYLVYEHYDAGHPHLHVITTNIKKDGKRIELYNVARTKSEPARKEIEKLFDLVKAEAPKKNEEFHLTSLPIKRIHYGKMESKKAITQVLNYILNQYNYTSFSELNAILSQYNVIAERCGENSKIFLSGGLIYTILNQDGKPIGIPIKASAIENKPTLIFLQNQFKINTLKNIEGKKHLKKIIDIASLRSSTLNELIKRLKKQGITTVIKNNAQDQIQEIIYIQHTTKVIFNDKDLGNQYTIKAIKEASELKPRSKEIKNKPFKVTSY